MQLTASGSARAAPALDTSGGGEAPQAADLGQRVVAALHDLAADSADIPLCGEQLATLVAQLERPVVEPLAEGEEILAQIDPFARSAGGGLEVRLVR